MRRSPSGHVGWCAAFCLTAIAALSCEAQQQTKSQYDNSEKLDQYGMGAGAARLPNVVLVTIDTLRPDHLDFYGYPRQTAPFLAELARNSTVFLQAHSSSSWTAPATASILTGAYPLRHHVIEGLFGYRWRAKHGDSKTVVRLNRISSQLATLPERLQAAGYRTHGVAANPNVGHEMGFDRGFDAFVRLPFTTQLYGDAQAVEKAALEWATRLRSDRPSFLYLHFNDVHHPYNARRPWYREASGSADSAGRMDPTQERYDSEIAYVDSALARLSERLDWATNTVVIVLSDHGEAFGEHGYRLHPLQLHRELNRVLFLVSAPDLAVEAQRSKARVSLIDVVPTLLDLLGMDFPDDVDGVSLVPLLRPRLQPEGVTSALRRTLAKRVLYAHRAELSPRARHVLAAMTQRWKLIDHDGSFALYDVRNDPRELRNVVREHLRTAAPLVERLATRREQLESLESERVRIELEPGEVEALRALGYERSPAPAPGSEVEAPSEE